MSARSLKTLANSKRVLSISHTLGKTGERLCNSGHSCAMFDYFSKAAFAAFKSASRLALTV